MLHLNKLGFPNSLGAYLMTFEKKIWCQTNIQCCSLDYSRVAAYYDADTYVDLHLWQLTFSMLLVPFPTFVKFLAIFPDITPVLLLPRITILLSTIVSEHLIQDDTIQCFAAISHILEFFYFYFLSLHKSNIVTSFISKDSKL